MPNYINFHCMLYFYQYLHNFTLIFHLEMKPEWKKNLFVAFSTFSELMRMTSIICNNIF